MNVNEYLAGLTDDELLAKASEARDDLAQDAISQSGSEWHQSCFAGAVVLCEELSRRGLSLKTVH